MGFLKARAFVNLVAVSAILLILLPFSACDDSSSSGTEPEPDNSSPEVSLTASDTFITTDSDLVLTATASDNEGVKSVALYDGQSMVSSKSSDPFEFTVSCTESENGLHNYWAAASDAANNSASSDTVDVIVAINVQIGFINGTFDADTTGWDLRNNDQWSGYKEDGGNPGPYVAINEYGSCNVDPSVGQEVTGFIPGLTYRISGDYRPCVSWIGNQNALSFVITVDDEVIAAMARGPQGTDWSDFAAEFVATDTVHTITFYAEWGCDDSCYDVDNLELDIAF